MLSVKGFDTADLRGLFNGASSPEMLVKVSNLIVRLVNRLLCP